jgi:hypothetical protein
MEEVKSMKNKNVNTNFSNSLLKSFESANQSKIVEKVPITD